MLDKFDTRSAIAISLVLAIIGMAFLLALRPAVPDSDVFKIFIGGLMTVGFSSVIGFYFGSSSGSKSKDDALNQIAVAASAVPVEAAPVVAAPIKPSV